VSLSLLLFKIAIPPVLVALMSLAARRWGPTVGGLLMGLPWMTGPVLIFLGLDKGATFAIAACTGVELGAVSISAFVLGYAVASRVAPWPVALAAAVTTFATAAWSLQSLDVALWQAALFAGSALLATSLLLPRPRTATQPVPPPWWDILVRMAVTFALVAGIMLSADRLGPQLSGIVASYPVILTVVGSFTHHQLGRDAILQVLRGISLSLIGFVLFFLVAGYGIPSLGFATAFALAAVTSMSFSGLMIALTRRN
jgi:hypothetical protein